MISKIIVLTLLLTLMLSTTVMAFEIAQPNDQGGIILPSNKITDGLFLGLGNVIDLRGKITNGAAVAGMEVNLDGDVVGNTFIGGQIVNITGKIAGDLIIAATSLNMSKEAQIDGDLLLYGGSGLIAGHISGKTKIINGRSITIDGTIGQDLEVIADSLQLLDHVKVSGDLNGQLNSRLVKAPNTAIGGKNQIMENSSLLLGLPLSFYLAKIYGFIAFFLLLIILQRTTPKIVEKIRQLTYTRPQIALGVGLIFTLFTPIMFILLAGLIVTLPLALLAIAIFAMIGILGALFSQVWLGDIICCNQRLSIVWSFVIGGLVAILISSIPVIGSFIRLVILVLGMGSVAIYCKQILLREANN